MEIYYKSKGKDKNIRNTTRLLLNEFVWKILAQYNSSIILASMGLNSTLIHPL